MSLKFRIMKSEVIRALLLFVLALGVGCTSFETEPPFGAPDASMEASDDVDKHGRGDSRDEREHAGGHHGNHRQCPPVGGPVVLYWLDEGIIGESEYVVVEDDDETRLVVEGDLSLGSPDEAWAEHAEILRLECGRRGGHDHDRRRHDGHRGDDRKAAIDTRSGAVDRKWDDGTIRYTIGREFFLPANSGRLAMLQDAINRWNQLDFLTGLEWMPRPGLSENSSGIRFDLNTGGGCDARVGRHAGRTDVNLENSGTCFGIATVMHEMGHAMGLWHEQQRRDRDRWIAFFDRNYYGKHVDVRYFAGRPDRAGEVGRYDIESLMHYTSLNFPPASTTPPRNLPMFMSRIELSLFTSTSPGTIDGYDRYHNKVASLGFRGIDLDEVLVAQVDNDGLDDLLTEWSGHLYYSRSGEGAWTRIAPGGQNASARLDAGIEHSRVGDFDGDGLPDVVRTRRGTWTAWFSSGTSATYTTSTPWIAALEVADMNNDGFDDAVACRTDGTWLAAYGPDLFGAASFGAAVLPVHRESSSDPDRRFRLAMLDGATVSVVALVNESLQHARLGDASWTPMFASGDSFLGDRSSLDRVFFVEIDQPIDPMSSLPIGPRLLDVVVPSPSLTSTGGVSGPGHPIYVPDVIANLGATAVSTFAYGPSSGPYGVDLRSEALAGNFVRADRASFIVLGQISAQNPSNLQAAWSDILALGTHYEAISTPHLAYLADRYPLDTSLFPLVATRDIQRDAVLSSEPGGRVELWASFMSSDVLREVTILVERSLVVEGFFANLTSTPTDVDGETDVVEFPFEGYPPGRYRVIMRPTDPVLWPEHREPTWNVTVAGNTCGDAWQDPWEECDDGNANSDTSPGACRSMCRSPRCGDGVVDSGPPRREECDDGNTNDGDACPSTCLLACLSGISCGISDPPCPISPRYDCIDGCCFPHIF